MMIRDRSPSARIVSLVSALAVLSTAPVMQRSLAAQAICSAPHSSPTLSQSGEIRMLEPGAGWVQLSVSGQWATEFFNNRGERQPFLADAEFTTRSVFLTAGLGVARGLEVWAQLPRHRLSIDAASGTSTNAGLGDFRVAARVGSELFGLDLPVALRVGAKLPGNEIIDATVLPLTEGQTDAEASLESGVTLGSLPLYVAGWVGYRWRAENAEAARHPGDELFTHAALGGFVGEFSWEVAVDALFGKAPLASGILLPSERRRFVQVLPTAGYTVGPGRLEVTGQIPVYGRVLPAAFGLSAGYRVGWGYWP